MELCYYKAVDLSVTYNELIIWGCRNFLNVLQAPLIAVFPLFYFVKSEFDQALSVRQ